MVRAKNPDAAALLDRMDADHNAIDPAMQSLRAAGATWAGSDDDAARTGVIAALDELNAVLDPHLEREENEAMPVVSATITQREWHAWDQASNVATSSCMASAPAIDVERGPGGADLQLRLELYSTAASSTEPPRASRSSLRFVPLRRRLAPEPGCRRAVEAALP